MISSPTVVGICDQGSHSGRAPTLVGERAHIYHSPLRHAEACHLPQSGRLLCRLLEVFWGYVVSFVWGQAIYYFACIIIG